MKEVAFRYAPENDETVTTFQINSNAWIHPSFEISEQTLLKASDGRNDSSNKDTILDYLETNFQVNQPIKVKSLLVHFVDSKTMSRPTFYSCMEKLSMDLKIKKISKGVYALSSEQP